MIVHLHQRNCLQLNSLILQFMTKDNHLMCSFSKLSISFIQLLLLLVFPSVAHSMSTDGFEKEFWMKRYLSVSYPLRKITVTSPYGTRRDPINGKKAQHNGIDLRARFEEVYSMFDGIVEENGHNNRSGNFVRLTHGNITVTYCHLSKIVVSKGDLVLAGDKVAVSGNTGRTTGRQTY